MRIPRIYTGQPLNNGNSVELEAAASQHLARALRMTTGDELVLFNGQGGEFPARLESVGKKTVVALLGEQRLREVESNLSIHLGIAVSRGDRMDWVIQKVTELGTTHVTPLFTERTEVKLKGERSERKLQHWRQVAISACEQCGRNRLPEITDLSDLGSWLAGTRAERKLVLHHRAEEPNQEAARPASVALLVGPEGGLSDAEILAAEQAGYLSLALGPRVLRTETAPLAAIAILQARWGDMGISD
jgi:16S rRNA (uracil1498-N3)-methyltransferase